MILRPGCALIVLFAAVAATLAGCGTPMRWERGGTDEATTDTDIIECRAIARAQHRRLTERPFFVPYFVDVRGRKGKRRSIPVVPWQQFGPPVWYPYAPWLANDQIMLKHDLFERCLESKGYRLVPDETGEISSRNTSDGLDSGDPAEAEESDGSGDASSGEPQTSPPAAERPAE
jgi:hypothetical protein